MAPSLTCATDTGSQQRTINCTVTAPDGNLHFVRVNNITLGQTFVVSSKLPCSTGGLGGAANLNFRAPEGNKYKITVADCAGDKYVYKIDKNGNVVAPAPQPTATLTIAQSPDPNFAGSCDEVTTGTGLLPGSTVTYTTPSGSFALDNPVAADGTYSDASYGLLVDNPGTVLYATGTRADGTTITSNTVTC